MMKIAKPGRNEFNDFYAPYIERVKQEDLFDALHETREELVSFFQSIPAEIEVFRYDLNKWSIKEVLMHINDFERYLGFKIFVTLRNDTQTVLYHPAREHYLFNAGTEKRSLPDLVQEFITLRSATLTLFESACQPQLLNTGNHANQHHAISAAALGFALVGHSLHHISIIKDKYLRAPVSRESGFRRK